MTSRLNTHPSIGSHPHASPPFIARGGAPRSVEAQGSLVKEIFGCTYMVFLCWTAKDLPSMRLAAMENHGEVADVS